MARSDSAPGVITCLLAINQHLVVECGICRHKARLRAAEAVQRLGPRSRMDRLHRRFRCAACGQRGVWGHISVRPCTLDASAWQAREAAARGESRGTRGPEAELAETLATLRKLLAGGELGGDGPVQWPPEGPSNAL